MKNIVHILLIAFASTSLNAQNFQHDFDAIKERLQQASSCHIASEVTVYESTKNKSVITSFQSEMKRNEQLYRTRMNDVELICNDDFMLLVDYEERVVQIERNPKLSRADHQYLQDFYNVDSLFKSVDSIEFVSKNENLVTYKISPEKGMIKQIQITLNISELSIHRIEYNYREHFYPSGNFIVIEYTKFDLTATFDQEIFKASDVVQRKGNDFVLKEKYSGFELLDLYD